MKIAIVSLKSKKEREQIIRRLMKKGAEIVNKKPEIVVCIGGDGSLLYAEHRFPGVPKVVYKVSEMANKATKNNGHEFFRRLFERKYAIHLVDKLEVQGRNMQGINDIIIRNIAQQEALRFTVATGKKKTETLIGDGCVIATPFGSSGYFYSITRTIFKKGIAVAFNNIHNQRINPKFLDNEPIKVMILRGKARVSADNNKKTFILTENQSIIIRKSREKAKIIEL